MNVSHILTPSSMKKKQLQVGISHKFLGKAFDGPIENKLGSIQGANVNQYLAYAISDTQLIHLLSGSLYNELLIGYQQNLGSYKYFLSSIRFDYYSIEKQLIKRKNIFYTYILQTKPVFKKIYPVLNAYLDGDTNTKGIGLSIEYMVKPRFSVTGEYFSSSKRLGLSQVFIFSTKIKTFGHNFFLFLSNSTETNNRELIEGTRLKDIYLGFRIERLFDLSKKYPTKKKKTIIETESLDDLFL